LYAALEVLKNPPPLEIKKTANPYLIKFESEFTV